MLVAFITNYTGRAPGWTAYYQSDLVSVPEDRKGISKVRVYPNPSTGNIMIALSGKSCDRITIHDIAGRTVYEAILEGNKDKQQFLVENLAPGLYFLTLYGDESASFVSKIMIL